MKVNIHKADNRGFVDYGWVKSYHSFNFAGYFNPVREKFGVIRVLNDEIMPPGGEFEMHEHKNLEIVIMPLKGKLEQVDSEGNKSLISSDEVQIISAGSGTQHSITNSSETESAEILQIWLFPKIKNTKPRYQVLQFPESDRKVKLQGIASPSLFSDILWINQDAWISRIDLGTGDSFKYRLMKSDNYVLVFLIEGSVMIKQDNNNIQQSFTAHKRDSVELKEIDQAFAISAETECSLLIIEAPPD